MLQAQNIQLSYFAPEAQDVNAQKLFTSFFGFEPDMVQSNRTPTPDAPFYSSSTGGGGDFSPRVQVLPGRIDIFQLPRTTGVEQSLPLFDPVVQLDRFKLSAKMLGYPGVRVSRIAIQTQLFRLFPSIGEVSEFLLEQADFKEAYRGGTDLQLQLNIRKPLNAWSGREMNRIVTLTQNVFQKVQLQFPGPHMGAQPVAINEFGAGILIDINSAPGLDFIPHELVSATVEELISESREFLLSDAPFRQLRRDHA
jgi:hypothetical protein